MLTSQKHAQNWASMIKKGKEGKPEDEKDDGVFYAQEQVPRPVIYIYIYAYAYTHCHVSLKYVCICMYMY